MTTLDRPILETHLSGLNAQQLEAVMQHRLTPLQVLAGAGTGKTEVISRRFVKLVQDLHAEGIPNAQERILVVTFTKDAAANMRERINQYLLSAGLDPLSSEAWIGTFHQVSLRLLKLHSLHLGFAPDIEILEPLTQKILFSRIVNGVLAGDYDDIQAVLERHELQGLKRDLLSLASFKTLGLARLTDILDDSRLFDIIKRAKSSGWSPAEFYQHCSLQTQAFSQTLTTLPTPELENPPKGANDAKLARFLLSLEAWEAALSNRADNTWSAHNIESDSISDYKKAIGDLHYYYLDAKTSLPLDEMTRIEVTQYLTETTRLELDVLAIITAIYALYQDTLLTKNACDFDDQINHSVQLLKENQALRHHYQQYFKAMIVDEFQDSNGSQLQLLRLLLSPEAPSITVVGDQKQSIYNFRFAQPENLHLIFEGTQPIKTPLAVNYRSYPPILWAANQLTTLLVQKENQQLEPCEKNTSLQEPKITWLTLGLGDSLDAQKNREAWLIGVEILKLINSGKYEYKDIAVLVPSHAKAEAIQQLLASLSIPALRQKNLGFFDEPVIKTAIALLKLMVNLHDNASLVKVLQDKLTQSQLRALQQALPKGSALFSILKEQTDPALCALADALISVKKMAHRLSPVQLFLALSTQVGIIAPDIAPHEKVQQRSVLRAFEQLLQNIGHKDLIQPTLSEILKTLDNYAADPSLELPIPSLMGEQDAENAVRLMTIHGAKGLEYPVVFIAGVEKPQKGARIKDKTLVFEPQFGARPGFGLMLGKDLHQGLPNPARKNKSLKFSVYKQIWADPQAQAEKQRLFYVALTRAKEKLFVLRSEQSEDWTAAPQHTQADSFIEQFSEADTPEFFEPYSDTHYIQSLIAQSLVTQPTATHSLESMPLSAIDTEGSVEKTTAPDALSSPLHLSFSSVQAYQRCPLYFEFRYRWKLPEPPEALQPYSNQGVQIGRYVHGLIHKHYLSGGKLSEQVVDAVLDSWLPDTDEKTLSGKLDIKRRYALFLDSEFHAIRLQERQCRVLPEKSIRFPWPDPHPETRKVLVDVDGVLDLLIHDTQQNEYTLIDFKTNQTLSSEHLQNYFLQLRLYRYGLLQLFPEMNLPEGNLKLLHLATDQLTVLPYTPKTTSEKDHDWEQLHAQFNRVIAACLSQNPPEKNRNAPCRTCAYQRFCPQYTH